MEEWIMSGKKQLVLDVINNKEIGRSLAGFWFHFSPPETFANGAGNSAMWQHTLDGHLKYFSKVQPEIWKIMTDGYFVPPNLKALDAENPDGLRDLVPSDKNDPWFSEQAELGRRISEQAGENAFTLYTIFSPLSTLYFNYFLKNRDTAANLFGKALENQAVLNHVLQVIAGDLSYLVKRLLSGGVDGIYYSVRAFKGAPASCRDLVSAGDLQVLNAANSEKDNNLLHICGHSGIPSDLELYKTYPARIYNWSIGNENLSLSQGKKLFGGKAVLGGFDASDKSILYHGTQTDLESELKRIVGEAGSTGVIVGADCTIRSDIDYERLIWIKEAAAKLH
jgi:uroporphyrinogen decarboxylase